MQRICANWLNFLLVAVWLSAGCSSDDNSQPDASTEDGTGQDGGGDPGFPEPVPDECITDVTAGEHQFSCMGDMVFDVSVPEACLGEPCGLVVDVHGYTMSGLMENNNTNMRDLGRQYGYVVVQPNAPGVVPNTSYSPADDLKVIDFIERIMAAHHLDPDRVHVMGFSQGGFMSWRLICARSDLFASASPGGAGAVVSEEPSCQDHSSGCQFENDEFPEHQLDILIMQGALDEMVPAVCARAQRDLVAAGWNMGDPEEIESATDYTWTRYQNAQGTVLEYLEHQCSGVQNLLKGHCYPGSTEFTPTIEGQLMPYACQEGCAFTWGEVAMDFFRAHPKN